MLLSLYRLNGLLTCYEHIATFARVLSVIIINLLLWLSERHHRNDIETMGEPTKKSSSMLKIIALQTASGGSAGFVEVCIMHPLDLIKTRLQIQKKVSSAGSVVSKHKLDWHYQVYYIFPKQIRNWLRTITMVCGTVWGKCTSMKVFYHFGRGYCHRF